MSYKASDGIIARLDEHRMEVAQEISLTSRLSATLALVDIIQV